jgi:hypothetical protein
MLLPTARMMLGRSAASQELTMVDTPRSTMAIRSGVSRQAGVLIGAKYRSSHADVQHLAWRCRSHPVLEGRAAGTLRWIAGPIGFDEEG